jgi:aspartate carbamoyltransferase catalytic subunit
MRSSCIHSVAKNIDVLYMTRVQKERFIGEAHVMEERWRRAQEQINLTPKIVASMKPDAIIMHPLPRNSELPECIDSDPRAKYFEQANNGLPIRMALLSLLAQGIR